MTTITSICECYYSDEKREENLKDKVLEEAQLSLIEDIINSANLYVIKCFYLLFQGNILKKCYGGFIIVGLLLTEIICSIIYCQRNIYSINKYIFSLTNKYISYLIEQNQNNKATKLKIKNKPKINKNNTPPKKNIKNTKSNQEIIDTQKNNSLGKTSKKTELNGNFNLIINNNKNMKIKNNYEVNKPDHINTNNNVEKTKNFHSTLALKSQDPGDFSNLSGKELFSSRKNEIQNYEMHQY